SPDYSAPKNTANISIAVCGDIVCHSGLNSEAKKTDGSYDYTPIFSGAADFAKKADYAVCTLETTFPDTAEYTGYPMFKSPPALASGLKAIGIDLINTASNHCMDSYKGGLVRTLDVLDQNGLDHIGTYRSEEERNKNNGILVKDINGISAAFLSFTYGTNGIPVTGFEYVTKIFFNDYLTTLKDINYDLIKKDMAAARALNTDIIVVMMHWGSEYYTEPVDYQKELADLLLKEGADIVLGGHCHVPEPLELRHFTDNEGNEKIGLVAYCLGNFVSCQEDRYTNLTSILNIDIQKNLDTGKTYLKNVSYVPMYMVDLTDVGVSSSWRYRLWNLQSAISAYKGGDNLGVINDTLYKNMVQGLEDLHGIMGNKFDYYNNGGVDVVKWAEENPL
ncbi:MAG: CapA family protein, partial [Clostridiales bacterium]|nr:CapA family protein [Clostridiales bacterium]